MTLSARAEEAKIPPEVRALVSQLGDDIYERREEAYGRLLALLRNDKAIAPLLAQAQQETKDPEIACRLDLIQQEATAMGQVLMTLQGHGDTFHAVLPVSRAKGSPLELLKGARVFVALSTAEFRACGNSQRILVVLEAAGDPRKPDRVVLLQDEKDIVDLLKRRVPKSGTEEGARRLFDAALTLLRLQHPMAHTDKLFGHSGKTGTWTNDPARWLSLFTLESKPREGGGWTLQDPDFMIGHDVYLADFAIDKDGVLVAITLASAGES